MSKILNKKKGHGGFPAEISTHDSFCVVNSTPFPLKSFEIHVLTLKLLGIQEANSKNPF